jgi:tryptophan synthase alpha chain
MNKIDLLFRRKKNNVLSVYFTAGYPGLHDTVPIIKTLASSGADMIEVGIPFSDPMADGPVIQRSNEKALGNGMSLQMLFRQLGELRPHSEVPLVLMGYLNPIMQFGIESFLDEAAAVGIDGVIIPDLPVEVYAKHYRRLFDAKGIRMIFLVTPHTSSGRIRIIDELTNGFVYMATSAGTTGSGKRFTQQHLQYFNTIKQLGLKNPVLAGFNIHSKEGFDTACHYVQGAIIGSAFINALAAQPEELHNSIHHFIQSIRK